MSNESNARFNGSIDEVALYNRALTPDEVASIYNADFLGKNFLQPYFTSPAQLPDGVLGADYTQQVVTILGTGPVSFSLSEGVLPPGMTLSSAGLISGVPSVSGTFGFTAHHRCGGHVHRAVVRAACCLIVSLLEAKARDEENRHFSPNPTDFRRKALSEQLLAMISASASDNRWSERLSLIDRRTVEASVVTRAS